MLFAILSSALLRNPTLAAINSVVPISAELATSIAGQLFPAGLDLNTGSLLITAPEVVFVDSERLALKVRIQAYYHRPDQGIAISEWCPAPAESENLACVDTLCAGIGIPREGVCLEPKRP